MRSTRKQSRMVCQNFHRRKIKCGMHITGSPCMKCSENREVCEARTRKSYAKKRSRAGQNVEEPQTAASESRNRRTSTLDRSESGTESEDGREEVVASAAKTNESVVPDTETAPLFVGDQQGIGALLGATNANSSKKNQK